MLLHIIHENAHASHIKELLHTLDTKQLFFIERACRLEKENRQQAIFRQWQEYLKSELAHEQAKK